MVHGESHFAQDRRESGLSLASRIVHAGFDDPRGQKADLHAIENERRQACVQPWVVIVALVHQIKQGGFLSCIRCKVETSLGIRYPSTSSSSSPSRTPEEVAEKMISFSDELGCASEPRTRLAIDSDMASAMRRSRARLTSDGIAEQREPGGSACWTCCFRDGMTIARAQCCGAVVRERRTEDCSSESGSCSRRRTAAKLSAELADCVQERAVLRSLVDEGAKNLLAAVSSADPVDSSGVAV